MTQLADLSSGWHDAWRHVSNWGQSVVGKGGGWLVVVLIVAAAGLIGYAIAVLAGRPGKKVREALEPYRLQQTLDADEAQSGSAGSVVTVPVLQRASTALGSIIESRGWRGLIEQRLVRAGLPISAGELALVSLAGVVILCLLGGFVGGLIGFLIALVIGAVIPPAVLEALAEQRSRNFNANLPDVLQLLAGTLRAGFSLSQALDAVVEEVKDPMQKELRRALAGARLGMPIEDALSEMAERMGSPDFDWTVMAIRIQREVGGNLSEILDTVAHTMIERGRLRREVRTLTAEGRISALILGALPVLLGLFIFAVNRPYIKELFQSTPGEVALMIGIALELLGTWWLYRTIQIEI